MKDNDMEQQLVKKVMYLRILVRWNQRGERGWGGGGNC